MTTKEQVTTEDYLIHQCQLSLQRLDDILATQLEFSRQLDGMAAVIKQQVLATLREMYTPLAASTSSKGNDSQAHTKPRILVAATGSIAATKFATLCRCFSSDWAEVRAVATKASLRYVDRGAIPQGVMFYSDEDEWASWKLIGDSVLHEELSRWADMMVIAPLSANTLGKIAHGLCDNLVTCIVGIWDYKKPMFIAPSMSRVMWENPFTPRNLVVLKDLGISLIQPPKKKVARGDSKKLACEDYGTGVMAEPENIFHTVRLLYKEELDLKQKLLPTSSARV